MAAHAVSRARDGNFEMIRVREPQKFRQLPFGRGLVVGNFPDFYDIGFVKPAGVIHLSRGRGCKLVSVIPDGFKDVKDRMRQQSEQQEKKQPKGAQNAFPEFPFHGELFLALGEIEGDLAL
jgi:hypothetical protein